MKRKSRLTKHGQFFRNISCKMQFNQSTFETCHICLSNEQLFLRRVDVQIGASIVCFIVWMLIFGSTLIFKFPRSFSSDLQLKVALKPQNSYHTEVSRACDQLKNGTMGVKKENCPSVSTELLLLQSFVIVLTINYL